ncbi:MAG: hypothetical protein K2O53_06195, partial [Bacteroidales bacterium]|nr:hypothetical protein [Bacteroidales bacterium]
MGKIKAFALAVALCLPLSLWAQKKADKVPAKPLTAYNAGVPADQVTGDDRVLAFVKGASRRTLYKEGSVLKIKTTDRQKVQG